jgi:hypothetical protein
VQLKPLQRRNEDSLPSLGSPGRSEHDFQSSDDTMSGFNRSNWVVDLPESLLEVKDFHFAVSASFRLAQSMGEEFLFDEVV